MHCARGEVMTTENLELSDASVLDASIAMGWCGPEEHGIARVSRQIADAATNLGFSGVVVHEVRPARLIDMVDRLPAATRLLHLQLNDWLFADGGADVDQAIATLAGRLQCRQVKLSVTLHDLPQLSDGSDLYQRRRNTYRQLAASTVDIAVSSEHERLLLHEAFTDAEPAAMAGPPRLQPPVVPVTVIPLPIDPLVPSPFIDRAEACPVEWTPLSVGIFGYLYPGKGHREVIEEMTGMDPVPALVAVGRASDRHMELLDELAEVARRRGIAFHCTGYVPDPELLGRLQEVTIPLAPHTHISASGSINSWLSAHRRPLVPAGRYVAELERRMPGALWIYQPGELRRNLEWAMAHPELTWLAKDVLVGPSTQMVAARYLAWLRSSAAVLEAD